MTVAEQLIEKGFKRGIGQGKLLEKQDILIKFLNKKFGINENEKQLIRDNEDVVKLELAIEMLVFR